MPGAHSPAVKPRLPLRDQGNRVSWQAAVRVEADRAEAPPSPAIAATRPPSRIPSCYW